MKSSLSLMRPVDATAARVTSRGFDYQSLKRFDPNLRRWSEPPPLQPVPALVDDLTGIKSGRLVVVGYFGNHRKRGPQWVIRCACGDYEIRNGSTIKKWRGTDMCQVCGHNGQMRSKASSRAYFDKHGKYPDE
jgi:hypothetical protein